MLSPFFFCLQILSLSSFSLPVSSFPVSVFLSLSVYPLLFLSRWPHGTCFYLFYRQLLLSVSVCSMCTEEMCACVRACVRACVCVCVCVYTKSFFSIASDFLARHSLAKEFTSSYTSLETFASTSHFSFE